MAVVPAWARLRVVRDMTVETESRDQFSWRYEVNAHIGCNCVEWHVLCYPRPALTALSDVCFLVQMTIRYAVGEIRQPQLRNPRVQLRAPTALLH